MEDSLRPCQDISFAGNREGILKGKQSSLWGEYVRLIGEIKPRYAIIENVEHLRKNGLGVVLNDLSKIGYDAEWHTIQAAHVGLPHKRERIFIISYPSSERCDERTGKERYLQTDTEWKGEKIYAEGKQCESESGEIREILPKRRFEIISSAIPSRFASVSRVRRVVNGLSKGMERDRKQRIKQLGNAVVPQIPELIGKSIMDIEKSLEIR